MRSGSRILEGAQQSWRAVEPGVRLPLCVLLGGRWFRSGTICWSARVRNRGLVGKVVETSVSADAGRLSGAPPDRSTGVPAASRCRLVASPELVRDEIEAGRAAPCDPHNGERSALAYVAQ